MSEFAENDAASDDIHRECGERWSEHIDDGVQMLCPEGVMSYDVTLQMLDAKGEEREVFWRNYTSNTAVMWREAGCDLADAHDRPAQDLTPSLRAAVADMEARPDHYRQWDAENGWGDYAGTLDFLKAILDGCERWPDARVDVSR